MEERAVRGSSEAQLRDLRQRLDAFKAGAATAEGGKEARIEQVEAELEEGGG